MKKIFFFFLIFFNFSLFSENLVPMVKNPFEEIGFKKDHVYRPVDKLTTVDLSNGHLTVSFPLLSIKGRGVGNYGASLNLESYSKIYIGSFLQTRTASGTSSQLEINNAVCEKNTIVHFPVFPYQKREDGIIIPVPAGNLSSGTLMGENGEITEQNLPSFIFSDENGVEHNLRWGIVDLYGVSEPICMSLDAAYRLDPYHVVNHDHVTLATYDFRNNGVYQAGGVKYLFGVEQSGDVITTEKTDLDHNFLKFRIKKYQNADGGNYYRLIEVENNDNRKIKYYYTTISYLDKFSNKQKSAKVLTSIRRVNSDGTENELITISYEPYSSTTLRFNGNNYQFTGLMPVRITIKNSAGNYETYKLEYYSGDSETDDFSFVVSSSPQVIAKPILLKRITLPTGGHVEFDWQLYGITTKKEDLLDQEEGRSPNQTTHPSYKWDLYAHIGIKSISYFESNNNLVEKHEYSLLTTTTTGSSSNVYNYQLDGSKYRVNSEITYNISNSTPLTTVIDQNTVYPTSGLPRLLPETNGRRERVYKGNFVNPYNVIDTIFTMGLARVESKMKPSDKLVLKTIQYAGDVDSGNYKETVYYYTRGQYRYDNDNAQVYLMGSYKTSKTRTLEYKNNTLIKSISEEKHFRLAPNGFFDSDGGTISIADGSGNIKLRKSTTSKKSYSFSPWLSITTSVLTEIINDNKKDYWKTEYSYGGNITSYPNGAIISTSPGFWRVISEKHGEVSAENSLQFTYMDSDIITHYLYNGKTITVNYQYYTGSKEGLLKTRELSLSGEGTGNPSGVIEEFDYSYGELSKYVLKSADGNLTLTTEREIEPSTGWVTKQTNPDGTHTTYQYDNMGRLTEIDSSVTGVTDSRIDYIPYNASTGQPAQVKLHGLIEGHYYYDGFGRLKYAGENNGGGWEWSRIDYLGLNFKSKEWGGAKSANLSGISNWNAITSHKEYTYDGFGRVKEIKTYAKGNVLHDTIQTLYDGFYKTTILKDSSGTIKEVKKVQYDAEDRIKTVWIGESLSGLIKKLSYEYHPLFGKMTYAKLYKEDGATVGQTRTWEYDELGNLTKSVTPEEGVITYSDYNIFGKWGRKDWGGTVLSVIYDGLGREKEIKNANGQTLKQTTYGTQGASTGKITMVKRTTPYGTATITYTYDSANGVLRGTLKSRKYTIELPSEIMGGQGITLSKTISYTYDTDKGLLQSIIYPSEDINGMTNLGRKIIFTYTNPGNLIKGVSLKAESGQYSVERELINGVTYLSFGSIQYGMGDGTLNTILNDSLGRLQSIKVKLWGEQTLSDYRYPSYDIKGNILKIKEQRYNSHSGKLEGRTIDYAYDKYNRLTQADYMQGIWQTINGQDKLTGNIGYRENFGYDYAGNLIYKSFENPTSYGFKTIQTFDLSNAKPADNNNRLPGQENNYDAKGNLTKITYPDRTINLEYDEFNMVKTTEVSYNSDGHKEKYGYIYDGEGKRVCKIKLNSSDKGENIKIYLRDGNGKILEELENSKGENGTWEGFKWVKDYYWIWDKLISTAEKE